MHPTKDHISCTVSLRQEDVQCILDTLKKSQAGDCEKCIAKAHTHDGGRTPKVPDKGKINELDKVQRQDRDSCRCSYVESKS